MGKSVLLRGLTAAILAALVGCHYLTPPLRPDVAGVAGGAAMSPSGAAPERATGLTITGRVDFPSLRKAQATSAEVVNAATVSLIDTTSLATVASGKTDAVGNFTISLGSYAPGTQAYILEAVKGLSNNGAGADAARFRTILRFQSGAWASCTNPTPGSGQIIINAQTTALAIESALDPTRITPLSTIGKVNASTVPASFFKPMNYTGHPDQEFDDLATDILNFLTADVDPIGAVSAIKPSISSFQPAAALPGSVVRITGNGFSPTLSGNTVTFAVGQGANVLLATPTSLFVTVPSGAQSGTVQISTVRGSVTSGSPFTVLSAAAGGSSFGIASFAPSYGRPGTRVTLSGQFGATQGSVYFTGSSPSSSVPAKVISWSSNTVEVEVPTGALPGRITVSAAGSTAVSAMDFDTWQGDLGAMTNTYTNSYPGAYTLQAGTYGNSVVTYGNPVQYIYMVVGTDNSVGSSGPYSNGNGGFNVFMWPVAADGTLGAAKWVGRLNIPRYYQSAVIVGNFLYVIGGYDNQPASTYQPLAGPYLRSIERATINPADGTLSKADGTKGAFDQLGDLLQAGGRSGLRCLNGVVNGTNYIWCLGGASSTDTNGRNDYEQFSVNTTTGALTFVRNATMNGPSGAFRAYHFGAQLIGTGILIASAYMNGSSSWNGSMTIPIDQTTGALGSGVAGPNTVNCPSYSGSYGSSGGQLTRVGNKVYLTAGYSTSVGNFAPETNVATVNTSNGQITGSWSCASAGAPNNTARNQNLNTQWNEKHAVVQKGGTTKIYSFGGYNSGSPTNYIQVTEVNADGSLNRTHPWGATRDQHYGAAGLALGDKAWVIGGYRGSDGVYTDTTEYYVMRDDGILGPAVMGPRMNKIRCYHMFTTARGYLYVLGGYNGTDGAQDTVERAQINADGTLGAFVMLPQRLNFRNYHGAAITIGNYLYVLGGYHPSLGVMNVIERAVINPDGSLGPFEVLGDMLPYTTHQHSVKQVGNFVYLLAGAGGGIGNQMVLRAPVYPDGTLGTFTRMPNSDMNQPAYGAAVEVFGNYFYRCGGYNSGAQAHCNRAFIYPDGSIGPWQPWLSGNANILPGGVFDNIPRTLYRWKDRVYLLSGQSNGWNIFTGTLR